MRYVIAMCTAYTVRAAIDHNHIQWTRACMWKFSEQYEFAQFHEFRESHNIYLLAWMFVCSIVVLNHFSIRPLPCATILWTTKKVEYNEHAITQLTISHQKKHRNRHKHTHTGCRMQILSHIRYMNETRYQSTIHGSIHKKTSQTHLHTTNWRISKQANECV